MATRKTTTAAEKRKAEEEERKLAASRKAAQEKAEADEEGDDEADEGDFDEDEDDADLVSRARAAREADGEEEDPDADDDRDFDDEFAENDENVGRVRHDVGPGVEVASALSPGQLAGLDPLDPEKDRKQAQHREELTNRQTDHEAMNALDPLSSGPTPGVTENAPLTAVAVGYPVTDSIGRGPIPADMKAAYAKVKEALTKADSDDARNSVADELRGWRTPQQMGVPGAVLKRLVAAGAPFEEREHTIPAAFFPETGFAYKVK